MSKFYELKAAAEQTQRPHWSAEVNRAAMKEFEALAIPVAILELLAIQAQLVAVLESVFKIQVENYGDGINTHINLMALTTKVQDALFAAGALKLKSARNRASSPCATLSAVHSQ